MRDLEIHQEFTSLSVQNAFGSTEASNTSGQIRSSGIFIELRAVSAARSMSHHGSIVLRALSSMWPGCRPGLLWGSRTAQAIMSFVVGLHADSGRYVVIPRTAGKCQAHAWSARFPALSTRESYLCHVDDPPRSGAKSASDRARHQPCQEPLRSSPESRCDGRSDAERTCWRRIAGS